MPRKKLDRPNYRFRKRGRVWVVDWTESGRTRSVSTGQVERAGAERWRDQWIAGRAQPLPPSQATIAEIMQAYTTARLPHVESKGTLRICAAHITRALGNLEPQMLRRDAYIAAASRRGVAPGAMRREAGVLRSALAWAVRERW